MRKLSLPGTWAVCLILVFSVFFAEAATADDTKNLYAKVAPQVVYLRHDLYIDAAKTKQAGLWKRFEEATKVSILGSYFPMATGSGFFIDDQGHLITNRHVVEAGAPVNLRRGAIEYLRKTIDGLDGRFNGAEKADLKADLEGLLGDAPYRFVALSGTTVLGEVKVLASSKPKEADLSLVAVAYPSSSLELSLGSADTVAVGTDVASFGYPVGFTLDSMFKERVVTMNRGAISAVRVTELLDLQHSAAISHGNSGGPLVDDGGRVVGVNTAALDASTANSLFYAVSAQKIREFLASRGFQDILLWNQRLARLASPLSPLVTVAVTSTPSGATVVADGRTLGTTPLSLPLPPGEYSLRLLASESAYPLAKVIAGPGPSAQVSVTGHPYQNVRLGFPTPTPEAQVLFHSAEGDYGFTGETVSVPIGEYSVTVKGVPGLVDITVPATVTSATTFLDLEPFYRLSTLNLRGWEPGASVYVDGKLLPNVTGDSLSLSMGPHTVAVWKPGRQPLLATPISVKDPGYAFVTWRNLEGFDSQRDRLFWTASLLGLLGGGAAGAGWWLGQDSYAVPHTANYGEYSSWKSTMQGLFWTGVASLSSAAVLEIWSVVADQQFQAQQKEFGNR